MYFYIKEWPNKTATLMSDNGTVLWTFYSVKEAQEVCREWYQVHEEDIDYYADGMSLDPACGACSVA